MAYKTWLACSALLVPCLSLACFAGIKAVEVDSTRVDWLGRPKAQEGLRYFLPAPYLVIEDLPGGRQAARIELGVDRSREFAAQPYSWGASNQATFDFHPDGTLKSFALTQDPTEVPKAVVDALKELSLEQLKIEQEAREKEAEKRDSSSSTGTRRVRIFRINGSTLDHAGEAAVQLGSPPEEAAGGSSGPN